MGDYPAQYITYNNPPIKVLCSRIMLSVVWHKCSKLVIVFEDEMLKQLLLLVFEACTVKC